jgi:hypothetical protein
MRGCVDAWMRGCVDAWMRGCVDAGMRGCVDAWMRGCVDAWMRGCVDAGMRECGNAGMRECGEEELLLIVSTVGYGYISGISKAAKLIKSPSLCRASRLNIKAKNGLESKSGPFHFD